MTALSYYLLTGAIAEAAKLTSRDDLRGVCSTCGEPSTFFNPRTGNESCDKHVKQAMLRSMNS